MDDTTIEQVIQAKGLTAPRVTPADIEANISAEFYFTAADGIEGLAARVGGYQEPHCIRNDDHLAVPHTRTLTFCVLILKNGFTVTGESACASPENFNAEIGREIARANAVNKVWPLMGYELRSKLAAKDKVVMDEVALPDDVTLDEFAEEAARPAAIIVKRPGKGGAA